MRSLIKGIYRGLLGCLFESDTPYLPLSSNPLSSFLFLYWHFLIFLFSRFFLFFLLWERGWNLHKIPSCINLSSVDGRNNFNHKIMFFLLHFVIQLCWSLTIYGPGAQDVACWSSACYPWSIGYHIDSWVAAGVRRWNSVNIHCQWPPMLGVWG